MSTYIQANTDGHLHDATVPSIPPLNRGFLYGDAVYEVWRTYHGVLFAFAEHWERLGRSAAALHLSIPFSAEVLIAEIRRTATAFREREDYGGELYVRLQLTRGGGVIGLDPALADRASWVLLVQSLKVPGAAEGRAGLHLTVARGLRRNSPAALNPAWKTGNYLNNLLCLREAKARQADEVVILNEHGAVSEAAVCNIFFGRGTEVVTPPLEAGILEGITRHLIVTRLAACAGFTVREETVRPEKLEQYDECFLTSSTRDIAPVEKIDQHRFTLGETTIGARLKQAFGDYTDQYSRRHADLRM